jgi:hypothetical protein
MDDDIAQQELGWLHLFTTHSQSTYNPLPYSFSEIVNNFVLGLRALGELIVSGLKVASAFLQDLLVTPWTFADNTADTQGSSAAANNRPSDARTATQGIKGRSSNTAPDRQEEVSATK